MPRIAEKFRQMFSTLLSRIFQAKASPYGNDRLFE